MSLSNYAEDKILDHVTGRLAWALPTVYVSLHTADPGETGANEITALWYTTGQRKQPASGWNAATLAGATNNGLVTFATVSGASVTVTHFGIWDAASGGNFLYGGSFSSSKQFSDGSTPKIFDQEMTITANDPFSNYLKTRIVDHLLGSTLWTKPTSTQLALYTTNPTAADSGSEVPGGVGYSRQTITFGAASGGIIQNSAASDFGPATGNWGAVSHWGLRDNTGTNLLVFGTWNATHSPVNGDDYILEIGDFDLLAA